nr:coadhesin-like isoform X2 [Hydra vulgaris]
MNTLDLFILIWSFLVQLTFVARNLVTTQPSQTTLIYIPQTCLPASITICEGSSETIQCPVNSLIKIQSAIYGRNSSSICTSSYVSSASELNICISPKTVTELVQQRCNNSSNCSVQSNNAEFTDPCSGIYKYTVVNYSCFFEAAWSQWSDWGICNVSYGYIIRTRECNNSIDVSRCCGNNSEVKPCFVYWGEWSIWSLCDASYGYGFMNRTRQCNATNIKDWCPGNNLEVHECFAKWSVWSEFSTSCGAGYRRSYLILETTASSVFRDQNCDIGDCPVEGMWGAWSDLKCFKSCGSEIKTIKRSCDNPYPLFHGRGCIGISAYNSSCDDNTICAVNGQWSFWSSWSACSQPCNGGVKSKFRSCSNPTPKYGGLNCNGKSKKFYKCNLQKCQSKNVNLAINFLDEDFINSYIMLSEGRSDLKDKIKLAITKLYSDRKVNASFNIVLNSVKEQED